MQSARKFLDIGGGPIPRWGGSEDFLDGGGGDKGPMRGAPPPLPPKLGNPDVI